ncbi:MAG: S1 RNA-binding domain-containing protein [Clostridiales bacterium]|jgi:predicted RNA-binding protein with RPS1 domain|nr:S1 RNA-binding domain-containing protein [Clostridiales bacterium]
MSAKLEPGAIFQGKVLRIRPFGVIVSLPDRGQGLVHISHISSSYVKNIEEHVSVGDIVKVKVLAVEPDTGKVSLSIKEAQSDPPEAPRPNLTFEEKFKEWLKVSNERQAGLNKRNKRK